MESAEHAATVVTLVILRSYYEFYSSCAKSVCIIISKSIFVYTKSKDSLAERFAAFQGKFEIKTNRLPVVVFIQSEVD